MDRRPRSSFILNRRLTHHKTHTITAKKITQVCLVNAIPSAFWVSICPCAWNQTDHLVCLNSILKKEKKKNTCVTYSLRLHRHSRHVEMKLPTNQCSAVIGQTKKNRILSFTFQTIDLSINKLNVAAKELVGCGGQGGQSDSLESLASPPPPFFLLHRYTYNPSGTSALTGNHP